MEDDEEEGEEGEGEEKEEDEDKGDEGDESGAGGGESNNRGGSEDEEMDLDGKMVLLIYCLKVKKYNNLISIIDINLV